MSDPSRSIPGLLLTVALFTADFSSSSAHASGMYQVTDLGLTPSSFDDLPIINATGQVISGGRMSSAGTYSVGSRGTGPTGSYQGVLYQNGSLIATITTLIGPSENDEIIPEAVNKSGMVVGSEQSGRYPGPLGTAFYYTVGGGIHAIPQINPYPNDSMSAFSVNDSGLIVGSSVGSKGYTYGPTTAYLSNGQVSWDLNTLIAPGSGLTLTDATFINDSGQIAGFGVDSKGQEHIVLLTPTATPEPSVFMILGAGILAVSVRKVRQLVVGGGAGSRFLGTGR